MMNQHRERRDVLGVIIELYLGQLNVRDLWNIQLEVSTVKLKFGFRAGDRN